MFFTGLAKKLYKILHTLSVVIFQNAGGTPSKSDKKDAPVIADMVKNGYYSFIRNTPEAFEELRVYLSNLS
ncbi:hypothetical protein [Bacillus paramycoides]